METETVELNDFQTRLLSLPEEFDVFCGGGRGGGKSWGLALLALRCVEQYGQNARILYVRRSYKGLADFELVCRELFGMAYGTAARYNAAEHVWRFPNGAYLELGQLETAADLVKYQGRSFILLMTDEAGQYASMELLDTMRANLRGPKGVPIRMIVAANPGGPGHHVLAKRYVFRAGPWQQFFEEKSKRQWIYAPSTFEGNHFIDTVQYRSQLEASCPSDPELLRAWVDGDWAVNRGAYFASVLDENRNAFDRIDAVPMLNPWEKWQTWLSHDFGSAAPSVTYLFAKSPGAKVGERWFPRDSLLVLDEYAVHAPDDYTRGLNWTAKITGEAIRDWLIPWGVRASGVADDAIFADHGHGTRISDEFSKVGVYFHPARKADRISGWNLMRRLLADAGKPDVPGLYIARHCEYFWNTVPHLARDQKRIEDVDSNGPDHGADSIRYGCGGRQNTVTFGPLRI